MRDTRETFQIWNGRPWAVLRGWIALSLAVALALLAAVWVVAGLLTPDVTPIHLPGVTEPTSLADVAPILWRNSLVLALHATARRRGGRCGTGTRTERGAAALGPRARRRG